MNFTLGRDFLVQKRKMDGRHERLEQATLAETS